MIKLLGIITNRENTMLFTFLQKHKKTSERKKLTRIMIQSLQIPKKQKELYLSCIEILDEGELSTLYKNLTTFVEEVEMKEIQEINKKNFSNISGIRKKEAEEKKKEMNSFSFLLHNL